MTNTSDKIFRLLPAIYRIRDEERGGPLQALIEVLAEQAGLVESDIARLYENWFIETCDDWVVPYIGDLLGVRGLHSVSQATFSLRGRVANTLAYRRRKGTATMLEQLARDTTGWPARAVEFFELLGTTQNYNHLRPQNVITPDLRRTDLLELLDTPFDRIAHTVDMRHIDSGRGRHNIPNIGLFLWRLQDYALSGVTAFKANGAPAGSYTFNPLGIDAPLFNSPEPELEITHLAEEINVPGRLRRRPLYDELEARRQALTDGQTITTAYFDKSPAFEVFVQNLQGDPYVGLTSEEITICNLEQWHQPKPVKGYNKHPKPAPGASDPSPPDRTFQIKVAVDPVLGRLTFPTGVVPNGVSVDFAYGFSGDLGGGPYNRGDSIGALRTLDGQNSFLEKIQWRVGVSQTIPPVPNKIFATLAEAVDAWNLELPGRIGAIQMLDSRSYVENLTGQHQVKIPDGSQLVIFAADLGKDKPLEAAVPQEQRPHLRGNLSIAGTAPKTGTPGELVVNGLLIEGAVKVLTGNLGSLRLDHCSIVPASGDLSVSGANDELIVRLQRSICGSIDLPGSVKRLEVSECILDGRGGAAVQAPGASADLQASTFFGTVDTQMFEAGNSIFMKKVSAQRRQAGCVRFCFLPLDSVTPRRFRCQPDLALQASSNQQVLLLMHPAFTSTDYGQPGYAQLKPGVPLEIRTGADDGSEMGAFRFLKQPQRETNLRASLDEYLRFGLEAGIFYPT